MTTSTVTMTTPLLLNSEQQLLVDAAVSEAEVIPYLLRLQRDGVAVTSGLLRDTSAAQREFDDILQGPGATSLDSNMRSEIETLRDEYDQLIMTVMRFAIHTGARYRQMVGEDSVQLELLVEHLARGVEEEQTRELANKARQLNEKALALRDRVAISGAKGERFWKLITALSIAILMVGVLTVCTGGVALAVVGVAMVPAAIISVGAVMVGGGAIMAAAGSMCSEPQASSTFLLAMARKLQRIRTELVSQTDRAQLIRDASVHEVVLPEVCQYLDELRRLQSFVEQCMHDRLARTLHAPGATLPHKLRIPSHESAPYGIRFCNRTGKTMAVCLSVGVWYRYLSAVMDADSQFEMTGTQYVWYTVNYWEVRDESTDIRSPQFNSWTLHHEYVRGVYGTNKTVTLTQGPHKVQVEVE